ncbi:MAG: acyl-CoA thioesterase [Muribaculaceae bacterium]|nr:acyl-CoA thioesterase [Muribaculaceae bacterium]
MSYQIPNPGFEFRHRTAVQVRFNDFDMFGHANNGAYLQYCDVAKVAYFTQFLDGPFDPAAAGLVIASIHCEFIEQIVPSDDVEVLTAVASIGTSSLVLEQRVVSRGGRKVHATVRNVMVQFDPATRTPKPIDDDWRRRIGDFEGRTL